MKKKPVDYLRHNKVRLVQGGREYFDLLNHLLENARESIHLQTYIFDGDETGGMVADALVRAAERGVKVYVLLDSYGSQNLPAQFIGRFRNAGIFFRKFQPLFKSKRFYLGRRLHHKVVVVDAHYCTVAGLNISNRYNDMPGQPAWLDWALYVEGEAGLALEEICKSRLRLKHRNSVSGTWIKGPAQICPVGIRVNDWVRRKRQIYKSYFRMFRDAATSITIMSAYFLPGRQFRKKIAEAAARGVKIRVIVTGNADIYMIKYAEKFIYRWMFRNNIEVYEYRENVLHGKLAFCDNQWMTIGSYNVNNLSAFASIELNLEVDHPPFVREAQQRIEEVIRSGCERITETKFNKKYNRFNMLVHRSAYEIFRFLFFLSTKQGD